MSKIFFMIAIAISLVSCSKNDPTAAPLEGQWVSNCQDVGADSMTINLSISQTAVEIWDVTYLGNGCNGPGTRQSSDAGAVTFVGADTRPGTVSDAQMVNFTIDNVTKYDIFVRTGDSFQLGFEGDSEATRPTTLSPIVYTRVR